MINMWSWNRNIFREQHKKSKTIGFTFGTKYIPYAKYITEGMPWKKDSQFKENSTFFRFQVELSSHQSSPRQSKVRLSPQKSQRELVSLAGQYSTLTQMCQVRHREYRCKSAQYHEFRDTSFPWIMLYFFLFLIYFVLQISFVDTKAELESVLANKNWLFLIWDIHICHMWLNYHHSQSLIYIDCNV